MIVADLIAARLESLGLDHVFGVGGANIEDLFVAVQRRRPRIRAVLCKHEHAAGCAADAYARVSGGLGAVMVTSGGGAMNLVHALAEARASRVPVLAIVGEPPTSLQGRGAFQDSSGQGGAIDGLAVFRAVSVWSARPTSAAALAGLLDAAIDAALGDPPGPAVLLVAKDLQEAEVAAPTAAARPARRPPAPIDAGLARAAAGILGAGPTVIIAGDDVARAGAQAALAALAARLDALVAVAPDARDAIDARDPRFLGVAGAMGHAAVAQAIARARSVVLAGTRLPILARQGLEAMLRERPLVVLGREPPFITSPACVHLAGDVGAGLVALAAAVDPSPASAPRPPGQPDQPGFGEPAGEGAAAILRAPAVLATLERTLADGGVVLVDAGNTGATAVHHLSAPRGGRWLIAMGMGGMGWTFGAAIGAACASGRRCTVVAGDGAFFMHGLEVHTAVEHALPITWVVLDNRAHGMCLVRERLLVGRASGVNSFRRSHLGAGLAAMFPGLAARDCATAGELAQALADVAGRPGPAFICAQLPDVEVPPFAAFGAAVAAPDGVAVVLRGGPDEGA